MGQYLDWLQDDDLLKAIKHVDQKYRAALKNQTLKNFTKNVIDPFTFVFDIKLANKESKDWIIEEATRQSQKTLNNAVGEFHQIILGSCQGWIDLGVGDETHLDIKKEDDSIFAEIKNKYNTMNSSSAESAFNKLQERSNTAPYPTVYLVEIVRKTKKAYNDIWKLKDNENPKIRKISGDYFYALVTKKPRALEELYLALPKAIQDFLKSEKASHIEISDSSVWEELAKRREKKPEDLSTSDLIPEIFQLAYPSLETINNQQLGSFSENEEES